MAMHHCILENEEVIKPWFRKYDEALSTVALARSQFKRDFVAISEANKRKRVPYPSHMAELPPFADWLPLETGRGHVFDDPEEEQLVQNLSRPPGARALLYKACRAYGNDWRTMTLSRLSECDGSTYATFDSGMAGNFSQLVFNTRGESAERTEVYVGVLTQILKLDYGPTANPILLFKGRWGTCKTAPRDNITSKSNTESGLLMVDFSSELSSALRMDYVVPSQVQQVFFYPNTAGAKWRTVLQKEARPVLPVCIYFHIQS